MKTSIVLLALSLALSVSAAPQNEARQAAVDNFRQRGGNRNGGGRNNNGGNAGNNNGGNAGNNTGGSAGNNQNAGGAAGGNNNGNSTNNANGGSAAGSNSTDTGNNSSDPQTSLTLDPNVIAKGFANNGQDVPTAGQVASLTSTNNFINFCLTVPNLPITNGQQIKTGSCNPAPMGVIPSTQNMPSSKFLSPKNGDVIAPNKAFTITMNIQGMQTGFFVNADENYFAAPQQLNGQGQIQGHSHVVVEQLSALDQTTTTDPQKFAFFKGLNAAAQNGQLTADVTNGLPAGTYKLSSINTAANHQPVLVPIAQHGSLDDAVYFTVSDDSGASSVFNGGSNSTAAGAAGAGAGNAGAAGAGAAGAGAAGAGAAGAGAAGAGNAGAAGAGTGKAGAAGAGNAGAGNAGAGQNGSNAGSNQNQKGNGGRGGNQNQNNNGGRNGGRNFRRFARSRL